MRDDNDSGIGVCGCFLIMLLINVTLGGYCFHYSLWNIFGKNIPWFADAVCGVVLGGVAIPTAVVCWVMRLCGVEAPFAN